MQTMKSDNLNSVTQERSVGNDKIGSKQEGSVRVLREFAESTSVHGLRQTSEVQHGRFRRAFWGVAFLGMLGGLLYTVFIQVAALSSYPTRIEQTMEIKDGLPFPAVTLCNLNQFLKSFVSEDKTMRPMLLALSNLGLFAQPINWSDPMWNEATENEYYSDDILEQIGLPIYYTLEFCSWDNKPFNCSKRFKTQKTDFGMCFTFNAGDDMDTAPLMSYHSGSKYGLTIIADVMQQEYMLGHSSDAAGLRVLLHDPTETPLVEGRGFDVGPGMATRVSLLYKQVNYLPPPFTLPFGDHKQCVDLSSGDFENFLKLYDRYNRMACVSECRQNFLVKKCGCRDIFDRVNATPCRPKQTLECYVPNLEMFMDNNLEWNCSCPLPCTWNIYEARTYVSLYPSKVLLDEIERNHVYSFSRPREELQENLLKLTVSYDYFQMESINQVPLFSFESIMSTLGGQMGIFLGASMLTLLEFLELGLELLFNKLVRLKNNRNGVF